MTLSSRIVTPDCPRRTDDLSVYTFAGPGIRGSTPRPALARTVQPRPQSFMQEVDGGEQCEPFGTRDSGRGAWPFAEYAERSERCSGRAASTDRRGAATVAERFQTSKGSALTHPAVTPES